MISTRINPACIFFCLFSAKRHMRAANQFVDDAKPWEKNISVPGGISGGGGIAFCHAHHNHAVIFTKVKHGRANKVYLHFFDKSTESDSGLSPEVYDNHVGIRRRRREEMATRSRIDLWLSYLLHGCGQHRWWFLISFNHGNGSVSLNLWGFSSKGCLRARGTDQIQPQNFFGIH